MTNKTTNNARIISMVTRSKNGQRRITVPHNNKTLEHGDHVEIKKIEIEYREAEE